MTLAFGSFGSIGDTLASAMVEGLPWPKGDAEGLAAASRTISGVVEMVRSNADRLNSTHGMVAGWQGDAANAFASALTQESRGMRDSAGELASAGAALKQLSETVDEAQRRVIALAEEVREAEEEANRAAARAAIAEAASIAASAAAMLAVGGGAGLQARADDASAAATSAQSSAAAARAHADEVRARNTRRAQDLCDEVEAADRTTAAAVQAAAYMAPMGGTWGPLSATPAQGYGHAAFTNLTSDQWRMLAYMRAGIDPSSWHPEDGLLANDDIVQAVYAYYGNLWTDHHELQWAGMANLVGPMFYAGWQDMYAVRSVTDPGDRLDYFEKLMGAPDLPGWADEALGHMPMGPLDVPEHLAGEEMGWYENRFLDMQKQIFDDLSWQHEAFLWGGVGALQHVASTEPGSLDPQALSAWRDIDTGDPDLIDRGNGQLLYREQAQIIQDDYDAMRGHHGPVGEAFTYMTSTMANNPIPGGQAYRDFNPIVLDLDATPTIPVIGWDPPGPEVHLTTPFPAGNIADFNDRWAWISQDMLPNYQHLVHDPSAMQHIVDIPVADRAADDRLLPDLPYPGG